jgi:hypothetical protein
LLTRLAFRSVAIRREGIALPPATIVIATSSPRVSGAT